MGSWSWKVLETVLSHLKKMSSGSESDSFANLSSSSPFLSVFFLSAMLV